MRRLNLHSSVKTGHLCTCSRDLNEWQVAFVHSALVVLVSPAQLYERRNELTFTSLGEKLSCSKRWINNRFHMFLYAHITLTLQFRVLRRIAIRVSFKALYRTIMWTPSIYAREDQSRWYVTPLQWLLIIKWVVQGQVCHRRRRIWNLLYAL